MKISYRGFTCSQGDVKVFYLFENNINLPKEEINRHVVLAQSRNYLMVRMENYIHLQ